MNMNNLIAADLGNSRIKIMTEDNIVSIDYKDKWLERIKRFIPDYSKVVYSSVNSSMEEMLLNSSDIDENIDFINAKAILEKEELIKYRHISGIGTDRILGLAGALSIKQPPVITIDCGTAVTVNALDKTGTVKGGAIFAGAYTQLNALLNETEEIKTNADELASENFFDDIDNIEPAGRNTNEALKAGILHSVAGGIIYLIEEYSSRYFPGEEVSIFTTGGYGNYINDILKKKNINSTYIQSLVLEGILKISL
jgi:pantothenate kinase type III